MSKSVITKRVRELEDRLKAQLLVRSTRRLTLTDAGASYFERCVRIVAELDEAQSAVRSLTVGLTGTLRVSCIASFLAHQLARDVCRFQQQHPDLAVELHHNDRIYDPIQEGYDICIQPADVGGEGIVRQQVVPLRRLLVATPDYFLRHGQPSHPNELIAHRCAHNNYILPLSDITFTGPDGIVRIPPIRPIVLSNSIWMIREAALSGDCVAILPITPSSTNCAAARCCRYSRISASPPPCSTPSTGVRRGCRRKCACCCGSWPSNMRASRPGNSGCSANRPQLRRAVYGPSPDTRNAKEEPRTLRGVAP